MYFLTAIKRLTNSQDSAVVDSPKKESQKQKKHAFEHTHIYTYTRLPRSWRVCVCVCAFMSYYSKDFRKSEFTVQIAYDAFNSHYGIRALQRIANEYTLVRERLFVCLFVPHTQTHIYTQTNRHMCVCVCLNHLSTSI